MPLFLVTSVAILGQISFALNQNPEERIGAYLKSTLQNFNQNEIIKQMELHFLTLKLLVTAQPRKWAHPIFAQYEIELIPPDTDRKSLDNLIDTITQNAAKNPYLHDFLVRFKGPGLDRLSRHIEQDGHWGMKLFLKIHLPNQILIIISVIPNVITYAATMENLNKLQQRSWKFAEICHEVWSNSRNVMELLKATGTLFRTAKTLTIQYVMENFFKDFKNGA